jgi:sorbitol-specific phosphotransferase system component IIC
VQAPPGSPESFTEHVDALVERLEPISDRLAVLIQRIHQDPSGGLFPQVWGGAVLSVVRYFDNAAGFDQLGLHLSERAIRFLGAVHACVDLDEYDDRG